MNQEDILDLMTNMPDTTYCCVILLKENGTFTHKHYGSASFLEKVGLIDTIRHEILQEPHEELHREEYHK